MTPLFKMMNIISWSSYVLSYLPRENSTSEVEATPTTMVEELEEEIPTSVEDEECFEDIHDMYDQLYEQFLKQQEEVPYLEWK
ncbi:unnamed protein product, partial [Ilex paraguariensis]